MIENLSGYLGRNSKESLRIKIPLNLLSGEEGGGGRRVVLVVG